ncbi:UPF0561 protein C2orf68-like [Hydractinia symbiolongicarpus]|uniref:UPF0561 protein C2orf68-like n=1 Tax=Hydractinia symbiolongicarpus TaxID=13093 RepID=UPI00254D5C73|nr:UPF0561 protein C2orf68-like [Hydractinia symbiolongicarpus]
MEKGSRSVSLDKNHGFMKFIIKNQIDRDIFDKEQRQKEQLKCTEHKEDSLATKEELTVEVLKKFSQMSSTDVKDEPLFNLEFLTKHGNIVQVKVNQNDSAQSVVENVTEKYHLGDQVKGALLRRVSEEIKKRRPQGE